MFFFWWAILRVMGGGLLDAILAQFLSHGRVNISSCHPEEKLAVIWIFPVGLFWLAGWVFTCSWRNFGKINYFWKGSPLCAELSLTVDLLRPKEPQKKLPLLLYQNCMCLTVASLRDWTGPLLSGPHTSGPAVSQKVSFSVSRSLFLENIGVLIFFILHRL